MHVTRSFAPRTRQGCDVQLLACACARSASPAPLHVSCVFARALVYFAWNYAYTTGTYLRLYACDEDAFSVCDVRGRIEPCGCVSLKQTSAFFGASTGSCEHPCENKNGTLSTRLPGFARFCRQAAAESSNWKMYGEPSTQHPPRHNSPFTSGQ
eukprot:995995-Pleurochrysis_carterae.AAC.1